VVTYPDEHAALAEDFTQLHEHFHSRTQGHYLTGTIGLAQLARAAWLRAPGVSVLRLPGALRAAVPTAHLTEAGLVV
jgi:homoserine dehydrogenase